MKKTILAVAVMAMFAVTGAFAADAVPGAEAKHECCCCKHGSEEGKKQGGHMCKMHDKKPAVEEKAPQAAQPAQQHVH